MRKAGVKRATDFWFVLFCRHCNVPFCWLKRGPIATCNKVDQAFAHHLTFDGEGWVEIGATHLVSFTDPVWRGERLERRQIDVTEAWKYRYKHVPADVFRRRSRLVEVSRQLRPTFRMVHPSMLPTQFEPGEHALGASSDDVR